MKVQVRIPKPTVREFPGRRRVRDVLKELGMNPESVIVIQDNRLLTGDMVVEADATIEVRPAMSGGGAPTGAAPGGGAT